MEDFSTMLQGKSASQCCLWK